MTAPAPAHVLAQLPSMNCPGCHAALSKDIVGLVDEATKEKTCIAYFGCGPCHRIWRGTPKGLVEEHIAKVTTSTCPFCSGHLVVVDGRPTGCLNCGQEAS